MVRATAKNHRNVVIVCNPEDYVGVLESLKTKSMNLIERKLALKAYEHTASYDTAISNELAEDGLVGQKTQMKKTFSPLVYLQQ